MQNLDIPEKIADIAADTQKAAAEFDHLSTAAGTTTQNMQQLLREQAQRRLDSRLSQNQNLRGGRGRRKSVGIVARWFHLEGEERPPTRVLMIDPPRRRKREVTPESELKMSLAAEKRLRKNVTRLRNEYRRQIGLGGLVS